MFRYLILLLLLFMLIFTACAPVEIPLATQIPTPVVWRIQYSTALRWMLPTLHQCILEQPDVGISVTEFLSPHEGEFDADFIFHWGEVDPKDYNAYLIEVDYIAVVVNPANPIQDISVEKLRMIFRGEISTWDELQINEGGEILAWVYPDGLLIQSLIHDNFLDFDESDLSALVAPDIETMKALIENNLNSIGFIPESWFDDNLKNLQITSSIEKQPSIPITLLTKSMPNEKQSEWINCLLGQ